MYYIRSDLGSPYRPEHTLKASDCLLRTPCAANATLDWAPANSNYSVGLSLACDPSAASCTAIVPLAIVDLEKEVSDSVKSGKQSALGLSCNGLLLLHWLSSFYFLPVPPQVFFGEACTDSQSPVLANTVASTCVSGTWGPLQEVHKRHQTFMCWSTKTALVRALTGNVASTTTVTTAATSTMASTTLSTVTDNAMTTATMSDKAEAGSSSGRNSVPEVLVAVVVVTLFGLLASVGFLVAKRRAARRVQTRLDRLDSVIPAHCLTEVRQVSL